MAVRKDLFSKKPTYQGTAWFLVWLDLAVAMRNEFTAVIERDGEWFIAYCPEVPGANGQGRTKEEAKENLADAIALILEDRRADGLRALPPEALKETVVVE